MTLPLHQGVALPEDRDGNPILVDFPRTPFWLQVMIAFGGLTLPVMILFHIHG